MEDHGRFNVSSWEDDLHDVDSTRNPEEEDEKNILQAAEDGNLEVLQELLNINPSLLKTTDKDGYTPLHRACSNNHVDIVRMLLEKGADIAAKTDVNWEPLHSCCYWNNKESAMALIQWGADVNAESEGGRTPLHIAAGQGGDCDLAQILLMHQYINPNKLSNTKDTPTDVARRSSKFYNIFDVADPLLEISKLDLLK